MGWYDRLGWTRYGGLVAHDGWRYRFDWRDARWAVPALIGESERGAAGTDGEAILWTMAQNLYAYRGQTRVRRGGYLLPKPHRYADVLLAYSQPINPYWRERGPQHLQERRMRFATMGPYESDPAVVDLVVRFMTGQLPMRPQFAGLVDFADCECNGCGEDVHGPADFKARNCFWKSDGTRRYTTDTLRPVGPEPSSPLVPVVVGAAAAGLALVLFGHLR